MMCVERRQSTASDERTRRSLHGRAHLLSARVRGHRVRGHQSGQRSSGQRSLVGSEVISRVRGHRVRGQLSGQRSSTSSESTKVWWTPSPSRCPATRSSEPSGLCSKTRRARLPHALSLSSQKIQTETTRHPRWTERKRRRGRRKEGWVWGQID